jgi:hypothetical protein
MLISEELVLNKLIECLMIKSQKKIIVTKRMKNIKVKKLKNKTKKLSNSRDIIRR